MNTAAATTPDDLFIARTVTSQDGLALYLRDYPGPADAATTVVCLPGLTRNSSDFHALACRLSRRRRVICPDYRGRGRSAYDPHWRNYQPRTYVDDLRHTLAALNVHRVVVIGTSLGGILAMIMSAAMPAALAGAVLNDIGPQIEASGLTRIQDYVKGLGPAASWEAAAAMLRHSLPDWPAETDADWLAVARSTFRETEDGSLRPDWDPAIMRPFSRGKAAPADLWPLFRGLGRVPVLVLRGETSDILSRETLAAMAAAVPDMTSVTVPGVGHAPAFRTPEELAAIDELLARVDGRRP